MKLPSRIESLADRTQAIRGKASTDRFWTVQFGPDRITAMTKFMTGFAGLEPSIGELPSILDIKFLEDAKDWLGRPPEWPTRTLITWTDSEA